MEITDTEVNQIVRSETAHWLASIWRNPEPDVKFSVMAGIDPFVCAPSVEENQMVATLKSSQDVRIEPHGSARVPTGISVHVPERMCAIVLPDRELELDSCISTSMLLGEGDSGELELRVYNFGEYEYGIEGGQAVARLVMVPAVRPSYVIGGLL